MKKSCPGKKGHPPTRDNLGGGGGVHSNSQANFSPYKHFGSPSQVDSVKVRQSEHARTLFLNNQSMRNRYWLGPTGVISFLE